MTDLKDFPFLRKRPRRNRKSEAIRSLVEETNLRPSRLIAPLFVVDGTKRKEPIASMPKVQRESIDLIIPHIIELYQLGIRAIALFPVINPALKDLRASEALNPNNIACQAIKAIKQEIPNICVIADVALDPFTSHGHDGLVEKGIILNDPSLNVLNEMACLLAHAGADIVAPSDMMDGRIGSIRKALDQATFSEVSILSYTAKYASSLYGPFRDALGSTLQFGDKKTYQMNPANRKEAIREALLDEEEGADFLLVKPALSFLDVISDIKEKTNIPVGAYQVSGEWAMIMAAGERGWINPRDVLMETLISIRRAGADFIFTYGAEMAAKLLV